MSRMGISIILCNYNHGRFLRRSVKMLLREMGEMDELILLDDASEDDSRDVIAELLRQSPKIRAIYNESNLGLIENQNRLLRAAKQPLVYFASADDLILPGLLTRSRTLLQQHPEAGLCSAMVMLIDEDDKPLGLFPSRRLRREATYLAPTDVARELLRDDQWFMGPTTVYRRDALLELGGLPSELHGFADGYVCRVVAMRHGCCFMPDILACWRRRSGGFSWEGISEAKSSSQIAEQGLKLMTGVYADRFPPRYGRIWYRRWLFGSRMFRLRLRAHRRWRVLVDVSGDLAAMRRVAKVLEWTEVMTLGLLIFLWYRPRDLVPVARRRLDYIFGQPPLPLVPPADP